MPSLHGYEIVCDEHVGRVSGAPGGLGTIHVRSAGASLLGADADLVSLIPDADCTPIYASARGGSGLLAWHADAGSFALDAARGEIAYCRGDATVPAGRLRWDDRLGSIAIPLLAAERGGLALHAAANLVNDGCLLICGLTGRGKSTLAAALASRGHPLLAEDGAVVDFSEGPPIVWPGMRDALITGEATGAIGAAAAPDAAIDARGRVLVTVAAADRPAPVAAVAVLAERTGTEAVVERLSPARGHRELLVHALPGGPRSQAFSAAARVVECVPVVRVQAPDRIGAIGDVTDEVVAIAGVG
jgi:hypothetical protein